jgi:hypothetical protein
MRIARNKALLYYIPLGDQRIRMISQLLMKAVSPGGRSAVITVAAPPMIMGMLFVVASPFFSGKGIRHFELYAYLKDRYNAFVFCA